MPEKRKWGTSSEPFRGEIMEEWSTLEESVGMHKDD